jgi:hypothetical protein
MRSSRRWSDTERRWGPFTYDRATRRTNHWTALLCSGEEEYPGCTLRLQAFTHTLIIDLPPILRPYREQVKARYWDAETIARAGRDWYWDEDRREVGFSIFEGLLIVRFGRQSDDSRTDRNWSWFLPWTQWRHVRQSWYGLQGELLHTLPDTEARLRSRFERQQQFTEITPKVTYRFIDFDGEEIEATTHIEEREWRKGTGWFRWLSWFVPPQVRRTLELQFSAEVGPKKGSWKGGTIGHSIEMRAGESHQAAFERYCTQHGLKFVGRSQPWPTVTA